LSEPPFWKLERFGDNLERWIDQEQPDPALRKVVIDWTLAMTIRTKRAYGVTGISRISIGAGSRARCTTTTMS
jgi:hypothetical protein